MSDFGGWAINESCFNFMRELLPEQAIVLELGSGTGTRQLAKYFTMYSIENYKEWVDKFDSTYIHAPLKQYTDNWKAPNLPGKNGKPQTAWYDPEVVAKNIPTAYDAILVDGPNGDFGRGGFLKHLDMFDTTVPIIFDDINRIAELELMKAVSDQVGRPYSILDKYTGYIL